MSDGRVYLESSYQDKDCIKALGGRWDKDRVKWYLPLHMGPPHCCSRRQDRCLDCIHPIFSTPPSSSLLPLLLFPLLLLPLFLFFLLLVRSV